MRSLVIVTVSFFAALVPAASAKSLTNFVDSLFARPELRVVTVTDLTAAGSLRREASPSNPIYYVAGSAGYREFGAMVAGERMIPPKEVTENIVKVLAKQGYLPASDSHPPSVILMWTWGTMNASYVQHLWNGGGFTGVQVNERQLLNFLGGYKVGLGGPTNPFQDDLAPGLIPLSDAAEEIKEAAKDHLYVASVSAYDYEAALQRQPVLLWTTKISAPARGFWLPEILPSMLVIASPMFGRETAKPVWVNATDKFRPEVILGDPRFVEYAEQAERVVVEAKGPEGVPVSTSFRQTKVPN